MFFILLLIKLLSEVVTATTTAKKINTWFPGVSVTSINQYLLGFYELFL